MVYQGPTIIKLAHGTDFGNQLFIFKVPNSTIAVPGTARTPEYLSSASVLGFL
jgi:hypothetical protein